MIRHPEHHHVQTNSMQRTRMRTPMQTNQQSVIMAVPANTHPGVIVSTMMSTAALKPQQQQNATAPAVMYYDPGITIATPLPLPSTANVPPPFASEHAHTSPDHNGISDLSIAEQQKHPVSSSISSNTTNSTICSNGSNSIAAGTALSHTNNNSHTSSASNNNNSLANMKEKTPMCLVNELARFNKIQHQYRLTNEQGPAHKKVFTVTLKLGNEEYEAEGGSIKKAQHSAAALALEKTQLKHPPPKSVRPNRPRYGVDGSHAMYACPINVGHGGRSGSGGASGMVMPTVELNALAMKRGERTVYIVESGGSGAMHIHQPLNHHHQHHHHNHMNHGWQQTGAGGNYYARHGGGGMYQGFRGGSGGNSGANAGSVAYFEQHHMTMAPPRPGQPTHTRSYGSGGGVGSTNAGGGFPQPAASITVAIPNQNYHKQQNMSNGGGQHLPPPPPQHLSMLSHHPPHHHIPPHQYHHHPLPPTHHMPLDGGTSQPQVQQSALPPPGVSVSLHIGGREYKGYGNTVQAAKHDAATKAIVDIKEMNNNTTTGSTSDSAATLPPNTLSANSTAATGDATDSDRAATAGLAPTAPNDLTNHELKSPISLVYEIALKRHMNVLFEVVSENGPPHMKVFVTRCRIGDVAVVGEGNGKKVSKKRAAEKMLEQLERECPPLPPVASAYTPLKRVRPVAKKKGRNLIKVNAERSGTDSLEDINPISRLIQIQQANKEKEPVYAVMEERGAPRRREFIIQATVNGCSCSGTGPNKKIAKRNAAQALLVLLGYPSGNTAAQSATAASQLSDKENVSDPAASEKSREALFQADEKHRENDKVADKESTTTQVQTANSGSTILGVGVGGRQLVPGLLLVNQQTSHCKPKPVHETTESKTKAVRNNVSSVTANAPGIRAKDKLMYLATLLDIQVQYSDFPKANHDMYLSLVSLNTIPPQVCHGEGATTEASQETAAAEALHVLSELGLDIVPKEAAANNGATTSPSDSVKNRSNSAQ